MRSITEHRNGEAHPARWWIGAAAVNGTLAGWAVAAHRPTEAVAVAVVAVALVWLGGVDVDDEHALTVGLVEEDLDECRDLLAELLDEHGPLWCDPSCACAACVAGAYLTHHGYEVRTDA